MKSASWYRKHCWMQLNNAITADQVLIAQYKILRDFSYDKKLIRRLKDYSRIFFPKQVLSKGMFPSSRKVRDIGRTCNQEEWEFYVLSRSSLKNKDPATKEKLKELFNVQMEKHCPALSETIGPLFSGQLLAAIGSLRSLACMTSRDIMNIGSKRQLFKYLLGKGSKPPPGLLYKHPFVQKNPQPQNAFRKLATAVMNASRKDYFSTNS